MNSGGEPELAEEPISGILFEKFPPNHKSDRKYFVMVSTLRYGVACASCNNEGQPYECQVMYSKSQQRSK